MQNKSLKALYKLPILFSTKELYTNVNHSVLPIKVLHEFKIALYMFKTLNVTSAVSNLKFEFVDHNYLTRNSNKLKYHHIRTDFGSKSISFLGPLIYNKIPEIIKTSESFAKFKMNLKKFFLSIIESYL